MFKSLSSLKKQSFVKFSLLLLVFIGYFFYLSFKFDLATGAVLSALTWSFFVLCTPVADAGFLLDFPMRLITGLRMWIVEIFVWAIAIAVNIFCLVFVPDVYQESFITALFFKILNSPWPHWGLIIVSAAGTFLSIRFGDEIMDVIGHKDRHFHHKHAFKHQIIIYLGALLLAFGAYFYLVKDLGINIAELL